LKKDEKMILVSEAEAVMSEYGKPGAPEEVPLHESLGRILAEDICSEIEMPPFDKSAMDGFAMVSGDDSPGLKIIETIPAGKFPEKKVEKGLCSRIMTGAPLPEGADRVVRVEVTREEDGYMFRTGADNAGNVCFRGEDIRKGDRILEKGMRMGTAETGAAASLGKDRVSVYRRVKAGLMTTGSEIRNPGEPLNPGQIYNSNGFSLAAQLRSSGAEVTGNRIVSDRREILVSELEKMIGNADLTIVSGGVSMGEFDLVPGVLEDLGVRIHFNKVAIQPGKPTLFGTRDNKVIFGLPGNPVSAFVIFEVFVKPLLMRMSGSEFRPLILRGKLEDGFKRRKTERDLYLPVSADRGKVRLVEYHGSAHFVSLLKANALLKIERGTGEIAPGETVDVRQI